MIEIIPTVVPHSLSDIEATADACSAFARVLHVDIADGMFARNVTWPYSAPAMLDAAMLGDFRALGMQVEVHLMVENPRELGSLCAQAGALRIIGHIEVMKGNAAEVFGEWKKSGAKEVGLGILFQTPLNVLDPHLSNCDVVQMMTIASIGMQGIPYETSAPARIEKLYVGHPDLLIGVDGGVSEKNIVELTKAGARRFCAGSALSTSADPAASYRNLLALSEAAAARA